MSLPLLGWAGEGVPKFRTSSIFAPEDCDVVKGSTREREREREEVADEKYDQRRSDGRGGRMKDTAR